MLPSYSEVTKQSAVLAQMGETYHMDKGIDPALEMKLNEFVRMGCELYCQSKFDEFITGFADDIESVIEYTCEENPNAPNSTTVGIHAFHDKLNRLREKLNKIDMVIAVSDESWKMEQDGTISGSYNWRIDWELKNEGFMRCIRCFIRPADGFSTGTTHLKIRRNSNQQFKIFKRVRVIEAWRKFARSNKY